MQVVYILTEDNYVLMEITAAIADDSPEQRPTPFNLTNHAYFNLAGHADGAATVADHVLTLAGDR